MRRNRGIFGGLFLFGRNFCVDLFLCNLWAFFDNHKNNEPIRMRECSYSAALSMKSALRCKKNKCSAFSKHRLDKKWRMLLFGRISAFFTTGSSISTMFLSNLPSDNLRARAIAWKSFGGLVNFSAGLHLIDQLGKGSEKCSVCKPYAYSRALRLFPCMTLYVWSGLLRRHQRTKSHGQKWKLVCGVLETSVGPKRLHLDKGVILAERWKGGLRNRSGARHQGAPNYPHPLWDYEVGSIKIARPVFLNPTHKIKPTACQEQLQAWTPEEQQWSTAHGTCWYNWAHHPTHDKHA